MSDYLKITYDKLDLESISEMVSSPDCGAISLFVGVTRNTMGDKKVLRLEYESYDSMAIKEMKKICDQIRLKWAHVKHIAIYHRIGSVEIKEASIIIAISSPHRKDSLDAVSYCINEVKTTVPVWKKEWYEDESFVWKENCECGHKSK